MPRLDPNCPPLWGRTWQDHGKCWTSRDSTGQMVCLWPVGPVWGASILQDCGRGIKRASGQTPKLALQALLGDPIQVGGLTWYPQDPPECDTRDWIHNPSLETLTSSPEGWQLEQSQAWVPSAILAYETVYGWTGWGVKWHPMSPIGTGWGFEGHRLYWSPAKQGWFCQKAPQEFMKASCESRLGPFPTREEVLTATFGPPRSILGITYYPLEDRNGRTLLRAHAPSPYHTLYLTDAGLWVFKGFAHPGARTPEECILSNYRDLQQEVARELSKTLARALNLREIEFLIRDHLPSE